MDIKNVFKSKTLVQPTIQYNLRQYQYALAAHLLALAGGVIAVLFGILDILSLSILDWVVGILAGIALIAVELDMVSVPMLKQPLVRGIIWIVLAVIASTFGLLATLLTLASGILYLFIYFNQQ